MARPSGTRVDHYELLEHLADGAQAEVHRAKDVASGREVVLKFPHPSVVENPVLAAHWRRELKITQGLDHPNVERRLDDGERHHEPYTVVEYIGGGSLDQWVGHGQPPLPVGQAVGWGIQVAMALAYLHGVGVVHRDVKPDNVLVTDNLELKLSDFGTAIHTPKPRRSWQLPTPVEGTPGYISPEQIVGRPGDERSDIYQWGGLMYELLTGHVPFAAADSTQIMEVQLHDDPAPIRTIRPDVPPALDAVVLTALHRRPERRHQAAQALVHDLEHLDQLDLDRFDLTPDPPITEPIGGSEGKAILRLVLGVMIGFSAIVALIIVGSIALH